MHAAGDDNETPWGRFYLDHRRALVAYAVALTGSAADGLDLLQDVLLRVVRDQLRPTQPRAFVFRCLRNLAIDRARTRRSAGPAQPAIGLDFLAVEEQSGPDRDESEQLRAALESLAERQREVIVLKTYADLTLDEIATVLECPLGTVASHYHRGIEALRSRLTREQLHETRPDRTPAGGHAGRSAAARS